MELHKEIKQLRNSLLKPGLRDASGFSRIPDYSLDHLVATKLDHAVLDLLREPAPRQLQSLARVLSESQEAPSIKSFNIMISRLTRLRQNAAAWVIFQSMLKLGYRPDEYTIASILNLCIVTGNYLAFRKVLAAARLQQAARYRKRRNLLFFSTAIKGFCKFGHLRHAETYYKLMIWEGNRPAPIILTCMLHGFANQGAWESGRPYFELLLRQPWDRLTVVTLLRYCNACKQPLAAERIRALALKKGTVLGPGEQDLAQMPPGWKTKGLDVPDGMKIPGLSDLGLQQKIQWHQRNEPEPQVTKRAWRYWHIGKWKRKA
jgi:pentatricopeptide repeat protein